jgi:hypothetical protein
MALVATSARLGVDDILRIRWAEPPPDRTVLILHGEAAERTVPPHWRDEVTAEADLTDADLDDGIWAVRLAGREVVTTDPGFSLDGLMEYARRPRTRAMHAYRDRSGGLRLAVQSVRPHAEVTAVHPGQEELVIEGLFVFGEAPSTADIAAVRRGTGRMVGGAVTIAGDRWRAELPNARFATETDRGFWDLRIAGLPVATLLDDIPGKKNKIRFPAEYVERGTDRVRLRAYYTDRDHLAIVASVVPNA